MEALNEQTNIKEVATSNTNTQPKRKRAEKKPPEFKFVYLNEMPDKLIEKALVQIYMKKIRNGTLDIDNIEL